MMVLEVENLSIRFPHGGTARQVVHDVSFHVAPGEILGVVGESGCGKSVVNLAVMGLLPPRAQFGADRMTLCGQDLLTLARRDWPAVRGNKVAMIFQNPMSSLNPSLTIGAQLAESIRKAEPGSTARAVEQRALELLDQVGIPAAARCLRGHPHELSGGMAQRVMIAMALACRPSLLIADEPTTALDVIVQAQILELLVRIRRESGMAMILVSHDIGLVRRYADRVQVMYAGEIVETGPLAQVASGPAHPYTAALLGSLPGRTVPKSRLGAIRGTVPSIGETIVGCRFASRCDRAAAACRVAPPMRQAAHDMRVTARCHFL